MSKIVNEHATPEQHPDDAAVDRFAEAMKAKLAKSRAKGRSGWEDKSLCSAEYLSELLRGHVDKGDPVDVANFCMMLQQRGEGIAAPAQQVEWRTTAVMLEQANAGLAQLNGKLRAELSALKAQQVGQEPVAEVVHCNEATGHFNLLGMRRLGAGAKLYTAPQPAPAQDVAGWIPVTERLPEVETDVLVRGVRRNEVMHRVAGLFNGEWSSQETKDLLLGEVTHWMPLPAAPATHDKQIGVE